MTHIRLAPERPTVSFTVEEAIDAARAAFSEARRAYAVAQTRLGVLASLLFGERSVTHSGLKSMRSETREVIDKALAIESALTRAIEAFESTAVNS